MITFYSFLLMFLVVSCTTQKLTVSNTIPENHYSDSQRKADYESIVKGTSLEVKTIPVAASANDLSKYSFYVGIAGYKISVYPTASFIHTEFYIDDHQQFIFTDTTGDYYHIKFGEETGYILKTAVSRKKGFTKEQLASLPFNENTKTYTTDAGDYVILNSSPDRTSSDGSTYSSSSSTGSGAKTVHVNGYARKDGTYVHSYYRSAPSRH